MIFASGGRWLTYRGDWVTRLILPVFPSVACWDPFPTCNRNNRPISYARERQARRSLFELIGSATDIKPATLCRRSGRTQDTGEYQAASCFTRSNATASYNLRVRSTSFPIPPVHWGFETGISRTSPMP